MLRKDIKITFFSVKPRFFLNDKIHFFNRFAAGKKNIKFTATIALDKVMKLCQDTPWQTSPSAFLH